ncbi:MAG: hypothetical protein Q4A41_01030 [Bacillota bacterium]|nr:hypothetical protein [Bacillota bacterium]
MKFYLRRSDGERRDIAVLEIVLSKIGLIGGEMYGIGYEGEENQTVQIYKIDAFNHLSPIEHTEFSRRDTYVAYAGELMMIHHAKGVTFIRPKDSFEKTVLGVKAPPNHGNVEAVMREIEECKEILAYFEERGIYDGETLNFESIPELGYRAPLKNFLMFLHLPNPYLSNLFEMSADELVEAQVSIEEIQGLKRRFLYLKELAENASL